MTWGHSCKAVGEQSRGWSGGSAEDRGPEDGCAGLLCREAQRMAVWDDFAERPRGRLYGQRGPEAETGLLHADSF